MSQTGLTAFDSTIHTTNQWLHELNEELNWLDRHRTYHVLRAVLHALRDRLSVDAAAALGAQLPMLVRGFYYEGWHPSGKPVKDRKKSEFLAHVAADFKEDYRLDPEEVTRAVFRLLARHISMGEIEAIQRGLPAELRELWPVTGGRVLSL
jgi:uncharacterized protein (DUF2267 family)